MDFNWNDMIADEDRGFLVSLNLSALSFLIFPIIGIIVPLIIWNLKKGKVKGLNDLAKKMLNFQITCCSVLFIVYIIAIRRAFASIGTFLSNTDTTIMLALSLCILAIYAYNLIFIIINSIRLSNGKSAVYFPAIPFLRK